MVYAKMLVRRNFPASAKLHAVAATALIEIKNSLIHYCSIELEMF